MKKIMLSFCILLFYCGYSKAQTSVPISPDRIAMFKAYRMLMKNTAQYAPDEALKIFIDMAAKGDGKAMNAIANIYAMGIGRKMDNAEALKWYQQACKAGYAPSWYNLGVMHKYGYGTPQDFEAAYKAFKNGAVLKQKQCLYGQGYMLYKGYGVAQDYAAAVDNFKQGVTYKSLGSMYMLGLCYRNGYGIAQNTDSARYWIGQAADAGYKFAKDEMQNAQAELTATSETISNDADTSQKAPKVYRKIKQNVKDKALKGTYTGFAIKYDWSGKHILQKSKITLTLYGNKKQLTGNWLEDDSLSVAISANITDSSIVFNHIKYQKSDHYSQGKKIELEFKEATLQLNQSNGKTFITGNIQMWNSTRQEPDKKIYISLSEVSEQNAPAVLASNSNKEGIMSNTLQKAEDFKLMAYPNPFDTQINLNFYIENAGQANLMVTDMQGRVVYKKSNLSFAKGAQNYSFSNSFAPGTYILKLQHSQITETTVLIKK